MRLDCVSVESIPAITLGAGRPWDIFFFVSEISMGARKGHFNIAYTSLLYGYRTVGLACAKAVLTQNLGLQRIAGAAQFVVVRIGGQAVGAAFFRNDLAIDGSKILLIEFLAVTSAVRRQGIGRILVEYAQQHAPDGRVQCLCARKSRAMQRLIKRLGFVRDQRSKGIYLPKDIHPKDGPVYLPSCWTWQRKA